MLKRPVSLSPSKKRFFRLNSIENHSPSLCKSTQSICIQTDMIEKYSKCTNTPNYFDDILIEGKNMNDTEFEKFVKGKTEYKSYYLK